MVGRGRGRGRVHGLRQMTSILLVGGSLGGCGREPAGAAEPEQAPSEAAASQAPASPWRFVPTLEQHLPAGAVAEPVLELSQPRQYTVVIVAAVLRAGAEHVELERWTFTPSTDGQSLQLVEGGEALLRLRPGPRNPKLGELRRELAAPRVVLTRPLGLAAVEPRALVEQLAAAFATLHDAKAEPRARVQAAATVVRGIDDPVAFDRDAIWELAELLDPVPAAIEVEVLSERRARAVVAHGTRTAMLELQHKSDGWAVAAVERPAPAPPTELAPDPK
jgi:hypothetical protein